MWALAQMMEVKRGTGEGCGGGGGHMYAPSYLFIYFPVRRKKIPSMTIGFREIGQN